MKIKSFIDETKPHSLQVSLATPLPGTEYYSYVKEKGHLVSRNFSDYDGNCKCVIKTDELSNYDLERTMNDFHSRYNF